MNVIQGYTFDDVLLIPKKSSIKHRSDINLIVDWGNGIKTLPIVSANMKHVTDYRMSLRLADNKCMALLHRFDTKEERFNTFRKIVNIGYTSFVGTSFGVIDDEVELFKKFYNNFKNDLKIVCIDIAHGHSDACIHAVQTFKDIYPDCLLIAGNIATLDGAYDLWMAGADVVKCGIGSGSSCSTRIETGNGVPQLTALDSIWQYVRSMDHRPKIIADGGLSKVGNIVKALCLSDAVMVGNMLAGTEEAPGDIISKDGKQYKLYAGSSTFKSNNVEGYSGLVSYKGPVETVIKKIREGLQSGCSYQGVDDVDKLKINPKFVSITNAGAIESGAHDMVF